MSTSIKAGRKRGYGIFYKSLCFALSAVLFLSAFMTGTFAWQALVSKNNEFIGGASRNYAALMIKKTVLNADDAELTDTQREAFFDFAVSMPSLKETEFSYHIIKTENKELVSEGTLLPNGGETPESIISLRSGEVAVIPRVPIGTWYEVIEVPAEGYEIESSFHMGNVPGKGAAADFVNYAGIADTAASSGSLEITKDSNVYGMGFDFQVSFESNGVEAFSEEVVYAIDGGSDIGFRSGGVITLSPGQTAKFKGIPVGVRYRVEEMDYTSLDIQSSANVHEGFIIKDEEDAAGVRLHVFNSYEEQEDGVGEISFEKLATGKSIDPLQGFSFLVRFDDFSSGSSLYPEFSTSGSAISVDMGGGEFKVEMKSGERAYFRNLPVGTSYQIEELPLEGYLPALESVTGKAVKDYDRPILFLNQKIEDGRETFVTIRKDVVNDASPPAREEFTVWLYLNDVRQEEPIILRDGQSYGPISIPYGTIYRFVEEDYYEDGYYAYITHGQGTAFKPEVEALLTNVYEDEAAATPTPSASPEPTSAPEKTTPAPTAAPTSVPTAAPTSVPTAAPTSVPTAAPTSAPTAAPPPSPTMPVKATPTLAPKAPAPTSAPPPAGLPTEGIGGESSKNPGDAITDKTVEWDNYANTAIPEELMDFDPDLLPKSSAVLDFLSFINPQTGESGNPAAWFIIMIVSAFLLRALLINKHKLTGR
ncbi:MAG: PT domain-containing protein [Clostridiales bacterium]|jgi:hypothetical protein|nr:PT domain-containing protein [Clostridiales bacterium]